MADNVKDSQLIELKDTIAELLMPWQESVKSEVHIRINNSNEVN